MAIWNSKTDDALKDAEAQRLEELCFLVETGLSQFHKVGTALEEIRDQQLYRREASTFAAFLTLRWKMTERHAERLIDAANLCRQLGPLGVHVTTERQARDLKPLTPEQRVAAVTEAATTGQSIAAVSRRLRPAGRKKIKPIRFRVPGGSVTFEPNKRFTTVEAMISEVLRQLEKKSAA